MISNGAKKVYSQLPSPTKLSVDKTQYVYKGTFVEPYRYTAYGNPFSEIQPQTFVAIADIPIQQAIEHKKTKEKQFEYTQASSPFKLEHQLAYSLNKSLVNTQCVSNQFWVGQIQVLRSNALAKTYGPLEKGAPNALYAVEKRGDFVRIVVIAAAISIVTYKITMDNLFKGGISL
ncbi:hypothetical protein GCM10028805_58510 [Spirosoma harenae]